MVDVSGAKLVVPPDLETAGQQLNYKAQGIVDMIDGLKKQLDPLAENWTGWTASYYQPLQAEWNMAAEGLFGQDGVLGQIAHALNLTWNNYSECEWANVRTWQRST
jgi:WXG100 family type VII secretion target